MLYSDKKTNNTIQHKLAVAVVLVNYNTTKETFACVRSIQDADQSSVDLQIFVVDNSDRDSIPEIDDVVIFRPCKNVGLSPAWSIVFKEIRKHCYDYVIFLNNDVQIAQDFFTELANGAARWGGGCAFGARIYRLDQPDVIWSRGGAVDARKVVIRHDDCNVHKSSIQDGDFETGHISGCCMVIPVELLEEIGGPDSDFFFRGEEWDLNYRLLTAGGRLVILDRMELWHAVNASHNQYSPDMLYLAYRAKVLFARKHHPVWWFLVWYVFGFIYAATIAPGKFSRSSCQETWPIRRALVTAFIDGIRWKTIRPRTELRGDKAI